MSGFDTYATLNLSISEDGRFVTFITGSSIIYDLSSGGKLGVYLKDTWTGITQRISVCISGGRGDDNSSAGMVSGDGTVLEFQSDATNFVDLDENELIDGVVSRKKPKAISLFHVCTALIG